MVARMQPWVDLCEEAVAKGFRLLGIRRRCARRPRLRGRRSLLGVNLLTHLDEGGRLDSLFDRLEDLAPVLASALAP